MSLNCLILRNIMPQELKIISKAELIKLFSEIENRGWIENTTRKTNDGAAGNLLEDLLGIPENNLPIPNAAEWELKTQKDNANSLLTLLHKEPSPTALKIATSFLLPQFGWKHQQAGKKYPETEKSFRATLNSRNWTRGFSIAVNYSELKISIVFDKSKVRSEDNAWLESLLERGTNLDELEITPYWGFDDLFSKARLKLLNCFYILAEENRIGRKQFFHYYKGYMLKDLSMEKFIQAIDDGNIYIDFDARTGHNHGTKFRINPKIVTNLYTTTKIVLDKKKLI